MRYHYLYMTWVPSGKYYVGRHSTNEIFDRYRGSGKWVRSIKDRSQLTTAVIQFYDSEDELIQEEKRLLGYILSQDDPKNMNFNDTAVGFASGQRNPAHSEKEKKRRSEGNWMKTQAGKEWFSINNPSRKVEVQEKRRQQAKLQLQNGTHNFLKRKSSLILSRDELVDLFIDHGLSSQQIAEKYQVSKDIVKHRLRKFGIRKI